MNILPCKSCLTKKIVIKINNNKKIVTTTQDYKCSLFTKSDNNQIKLHE
jgi:hypothetical protein